jgi:DNA polymerase III subunit delta'
MLAKALMMSRAMSGRLAMAEPNEDPREIPWHPRMAQAVVGHEAASAQFLKALNSGKPHHAWLIHGPKGIGKATLAYHLAGQVLAGANPAQARHWIQNRSHPDLFVLERQLNDSKPRRLKSEIAVDDARQLARFLSHTSSGGWRVAIVDAADDLNAESGNAILKLVEEPPSNVVLFLVSHQPGTLLRTLKSRCLRLALHPIGEQATIHVIKGLPLDPSPQHEELVRAARQSGGSPGRALQLLTSQGAKAFARFAQIRQPKAADFISIASLFQGRGVGPDEFTIFNDLLLDWLANQASAATNARLATVHGQIAESARRTEAFNLDRRQAVLAELTLVNDALKAS